MTSISSQNSFLGAAIDIRKPKIYKPRNKQELNQSLEGKSLVSSNPQNFFRVHNTHQERLCNLLEDFYISQRKSNAHTDITSQRHNIRKRRVLKTGVLTSQNLQTENSLMDPITLPNITIASFEGSVDKLIHESEEHPDIVTTQLNNSTLQTQQSENKASSHKNAVLTTVTLSVVRDCSKPVKDDSYSRLRLHIQSQNRSRPKTRSSINRESTSFQKSIDLKSSPSNSPKKPQFKIPEIKLEIKDIFNIHNEEGREKQKNPVIPAKKRSYTPSSKRKNTEIKMPSGKGTCRLYQSNIKSSNLYLENKRISQEKSINSILEGIIIKRSYG